MFTLTRADPIATEHAVQLTAQQAAFDHLFGTTEIFVTYFITKAAGIRKPLQQLNLLKVQHNWHLRWCTGEKTRNEATQPSEEQASMSGGAPEVLGKSVPSQRV